MSKAPIKRRPEKAPKPASAVANVSDTPSVLRVYQKPEESPAEALARTSLDPAVQAAATLRAFDKNFGNLSLNALAAKLQEQGSLASANDLTRADAILTAQAHTLDALFNELAQRSVLNSNAGYLPASEAYLKLALRAQNQCRATWETLSAIKNPASVAFVRQANIAHTQQVNNGTDPRAEIQKSAERTIEVDA